MWREKETDIIKTMLERGSFSWPGWTGRKEAASGGAVLGSHVVWREAGGPRPRPRHGAGVGVL